MGKLKIHNNSAYAPIRFQAIANATGQLPYPKEIKTIEDFSTCFTPLFEMLKQEFSYMNSTINDFLNFEAMSRVCYETFCKHGKVIYDINALITTCLENSDIQDISCNQLELPNQSFYLYFDRSSSSMEGVYVTGLEGYLCILPVMKECYKDNMIRVASKEDDPIFLIFRLLPGERITQAYKAMLEEIVVKKNNGTLRTSHIETQEACLKLVINAILYINSQPQDIEYDWGRDTPQNLVSKISKIKTLGKKAVQENALRNQGYSKVKFVGRHYEQSTEGGHLKQFFQYSDQREKATHLRRGHFRNQACGKELKDRKIIYIAPTIINPYSPSKRGTVYTI